MRAVLPILLATAATAAPLGSAPAASPVRQLAETEVRGLLRDAAATALGPEFEISAIHYRGDLALRGDNLAVEVEPPPARLPTGRASLRAVFRTAQETRPVSFSVDVVAAGRGPIVRRGSSVVVQARSGSVLVTADGEAQQDGAAGDRIRVLCPALRRVVVGRVVDPQTVLIELGGRR